MGYNEVELRWDLGGTYVVVAELFVGEGKRESRGNPAECVKNPDSIIKPLG